MQEIEEEEYRETLKNMARKKYDALKNEQYLRRKYKVKQHLMRKGYEYDLVNQVLEEIAS